MDLELEICLIVILLFELFILWRILKLKEDNVKTHNYLYGIALKNEVLKRESKPIETELLKIPKIEEKKNIKVEIAKLLSEIVKNLEKL
jgi:hypothetical protein